MGLKPFVTEFGAAGFVERSAAGPVSVSIVLPKKRLGAMRLITFYVTYTAQGGGVWLPAEIRERDTGVVRTARRRAI